MTGVHWPCQNRADQLGTGLLFFKGPWSVEQPHSVGSLLAFVDSGFRYE